ncbi:MAG: class D beta-lactamase [Acidobacteria bacterium]|nr:class D beta-lactamase [Acidobacteriota bacterium]
MLNGATLSAPREDRDLADIFKRAGVSGTIVIERADGKRRYVYDSARARRPFPVASTFKIFNSLIALEEKVIAGPADLFKWDGTTRSIADWNRDQTLRSAYRVSCVWCYQELARRIGPEKYLFHLNRAGYGRLSPVFRLTEFWLDGTLRLSADDQVAFLRRLVDRSLPYRADSYEMLREIMLMESGPGIAYSLRAKTGWSTLETPGVGWYIGYTESARGVWIFALNIDIRTERDLPLRIGLAREALRIKGILPQ